MGSHLRTLNLGIYVSHHHATATSAGVSYLTERGLGHDS